MDDRSRATAPEVLFILTCEFESLTYKLQVPLINSISPELVMESPLEDELANVVILLAVVVYKLI